MLKILSALLPSSYIPKSRWITSVTIVVFATFTGSLLASSASGDLAQSRAIDSPIGNGIHLYGESPRPNVVGKEYIIFEKSRNQTVGAFYLPRSEFSCFKGQFKDARLNVTLFDPFDRRKYIFSLALAPDGMTASKQPMMGQPTYQPLSKISANDRRILAACKQQLQK